MDDLASFLSHLVTVPGVTREPIGVDQLVTEIIPYRAHRRALGVVSIDQYEALVLRLCAGEGGYARLIPPTLSESCRQALEGPDTGLASVPGVETGKLLLLDRAWNLETSREQEGNDAPMPEPVPFAPLRPDPPDPPAASATGWSETPAPPVSRDEAPDPLNEAPDEVPGPRDEVPDPPVPIPGQRAVPGVCPACRFVLPHLDNLKFCPGCGARVAPAECPGCGETVLPAWRHCPGCGHRLAPAGLV